MGAEFPSILVKLLILSNSLFISLVAATENKNAPRARGHKAEERNLGVKLMGSKIEVIAELHQIKCT